MRIFDACTSNENERPEEKSDSLKNKVLNPKDLYVRVHGNEERKCSFDDALLYGFGLTENGKRIDPAKVFAGLDAPSEWSGEDDLTWLARNAKLFSEGECCAVRYPKDHKGYLLFPHNDNDDITKFRGHTIYTSYEILQRRRELGLESNCSEIPGSTQPDWDLASYVASFYDDKPAQFMNSKHEAECLLEWISEKYRIIPRPDQSKSTDKEELPAAKYDLEEVHEFLLGLSELDEPKYDVSIHSSPDAVRWADFYMSVWPNGCSDRDTMIGWFANAMEAMADSLRSEPQEQEWDGEGLPPVGVECEVRFKAPGTLYSEWYKGAFFKAGYDSKIWFCAQVEPPFIKEMVMPSHDVQFRPTQSEAERKREEAVEFALLLLPDKEVASVEWYEHARRVIEALQSKGLLKGEA